MSARPNSYAFCGGAFGDEGKGRIVDTYVHQTPRHQKVVVYRDNGGANAGHTVAFADKKIALHQLLSGVFEERAITILGKGMVIHPADLVTEIEQVKQATGGGIPAQIIIDGEAIACLDTHRVFENVLKQWQSGGSGSTGRGISPAYADLIYRHPIQIRDLVEWNQEKLEQHYSMYAALIKGLGAKMAEQTVARLAGPPELLGSKKQFLSQLKAATAVIQQYVLSPTQLLRDTWADPNTRFIFEKAQAIGLDIRWGVYPDVTASDCTLAGIYGSTYGIVDPDDIAVRAGVIKATYMSSVGSRRLPTQMDDPSAHRIREDAHEYGATTKRPRDIAHLDLVALKTYARVGRLTHLVLTHLDIAYSETAIQVCRQYQLNGQPVEYHPDQRYLNQVKPIYQTLPSWNGSEVQSITQLNKLPENCKSFISYLEKEFELPVAFVTTGPKRGEEIQLLS